MKTSFLHLVEVLCLAGGLLIAANATDAGAQAAADQAAPGAAPTARVIADKRTPPPPFREPEEDGLRFNFRGVPLETVLDYLSRAAGFVVVREATAEGTVDVLSHQPLSRDEAVELLNTILKEKGLAAVRNGRTLTIVKLDEARTRNLPVRTGNIPEAIPRSDGMVTQIIPVQYVEVDQLIRNLQPLLPSYATLTANADSNAVILTDTQSNIRRMVEIVRALDTSVSEISQLRVFTLRHANATEMAKTVTDIFNSGSGSSASRSGSGSGAPIRFFRRRDDQASGASSTQADSSPARQARSRVVAIADTRTNSVVVNAPADLMPSIQGLIEEIDATSENAAELRVFPLKYADAGEIADVVNNLFGDRGGAGRTSGAGIQPNFFAMRGGRTAGAAASQTETGGSRSRVVAIAEEQTNTVVVSAPKETMSVIEEMIEKVDTITEDTTELRVFALRHANAEDTAKTINEILARTDRSSNADQPQPFGRSLFSRMAPSADTAQSNRSSDRMVQDRTVVAVADTRTNSVIVRAAGKVMVWVEAMVKQLDANPAGVEKVYFYSLNNADVSEMLPILQGLFGGTDAVVRSTTVNTNTETRGNTRTGATGVRGTRERGGSDAASFGSLR